MIYRLLNFSNGSSLEGNNVDTMPNNSVADGTAPDGNGSAPREKPKEEGGGKKERSVLQAKLTKLAIQIGYAGTREN